MKRMVGICMMLALVLFAFAGCMQPKSPITTPAPLPTTNPPAVVTPGTPSASPSTPTDTGGTGQTGQTGYYGNNGTSGTTGYGTGGNTGTNNQTGAGNYGTNSTTGVRTTIPNFKTGTEVLVSDVPDIKSAMLGRYKDASISRITHGMYNNQQVYVISYKTQNGKTQTAYIGADGKFVTATNVITP